MEQANSKKQVFFSTTRIAFIAMFATVAGVLYLFNFPIAAAFPSFLKLDFSDIPVFIGTFTLGPLAGVVIIFVKIAIKLLIKMTSSMFVGELADLLIGIAFVIPAGVIYKKHRTLKGALIAMAVGTFTSVAVAILVNRVILIPFYIQLYFNGSSKPLISIMNALFPNCTEDNFYNYYLWASVLPFNLMRLIIADTVTLLVYKRTSKLINTVNRKIYGTQSADDTSVRKANLAVPIAAATAVALMLLFILLRYFVF